MNMYRQGDLLFVEIKNIPKDAQHQKDGIIAKGEVTGHSHRIRQQQQAVLLVAAGIAYIKALRDTEIDHEEHNTIILPSGNWEVKRQQEYEPSGWRQVLD